MKKRIQKMLSIILACVIIPSACVITAHAEPTPSRDNELPIMTQPTGATEPIDPTQPTEKAIVELQFSNTAEGTLISWSSVEGAAVYELYQHEGGRNDVIVIADGRGSGKASEIVCGDVFSLDGKTITGQNRKRTSSQGSSHEKNLFDRIRKRRDRQDHVRCQSRRASC